MGNFIATFWLKKMMDDFDQHKKLVLCRYKEAIDKGLVDTGIIPLNTRINELENYMTTSSCMGRKTIISKRSLRSKYQTHFHYKSHDPKGRFTQTLEELSFTDELWFLVEPPNIHINCRNLESAKALVSLALEVKLGRSKYQSLFPKVIVEILGTSSLQVPLGQGGKVLINPELMDLLWVKSEEILTVEQQRLHDFQSRIGEL